MRPYRELAAGEVPEQAAERLVALSDDVVVGAFERHAVEPPRPQVVAAAGDRIMPAEQRRERNEPRQGVLAGSLPPVARPWGRTPVACRALARATRATH